MALTDEPRDLPRVDEVAGLAQALEAADVRDAHAGDLAGPKGDDLAVVAEAGEVLDDAAGVDVGGVREIEDTHEAILTSPPNPPLR